MTKTEMYYKIGLWLRGIKGLGRVAVRKVLAATDDPEAILYGDLSTIKPLEALLNRPARLLLNERDPLALEAQWQKAAKGCDAIIGIWDEAYPQGLAELHEPPIALHCKGHFQWLAKDFQGVGIVGTRSPSEYGRQQSYDIAKNLGQNGACIISGLAMGIDASAHLGAIGGGGKTIAVLGTGVDLCYPKFNQKLYHDIAQKGLLVSEYPSGSLPISTHFPERNRLIAGLSSSCIVIEAARKSGSLITAEMAMDLGKDVYALPGPIHSAKSTGCHWLIRDGATPIVDQETLLQDLDLRGPDLSQIKIKVAPKEHPLMELLKAEGAMTIEMLYGKSGMSMSELIVSLDALISENYVKSSGFLYHL